MEKHYDPENRNDRTELAHALREMFSTAKFRHENEGGQCEEIYSFQTSHAQIRIVVYSTIINNSCRASGKDAIRVVSVYTAKDGQDRGIVKETRINRTGTIQGITARTLDRMRSVYKLSVHPDKCTKCGAPKFISAKNNAVCAELCWMKK